MTDPPRIRLFLIDDHIMVREGLRAVLSRRKDFQIVGEASSVEEAESSLEKISPEIILLDIRLPGMDGLDGCRHFTKNFPDTKVIILTSFIEQKMIMKAMESGARGYLLKEIESDQLCENIIQVSRGQVILPDSVAHEWISGIHRSKEHDRLVHRFNQLSHQEKNVAREVSRGLMNKEIADSLGLSEKTVKNYLTHIFTKLDITRRSQLAVLYCRFNSEGDQP